MVGLNKARSLALCEINFTQLYGPINKTASVRTPTNLP